MNDTPATNYDDKLHKVYQMARQLPEKTMSLWMDYIGRYIRQECPITFLDIGSGTGRFSKAIVDRFNCRVIGIEPSDKMREKAVSSIQDDNVSFLKGSASNIPLTDASCTHAWLSMVIHHIPYLSECIVELNRVLIDDGLIFIRNSFREHLNDICMYRYFHRALEIDTSRIPSISSIVSKFGEFGISLLSHDVIDQVIDISFENHIARLSQRGISTLELLSDAEFHEGIQAMKKASSTYDPKLPIIEKIDLLVFKST